MYPESDLAPISALQHLIFCRRQCALIHLERIWVENPLTLEGRHLHRKAHTARSQQREDQRTARSLPVRSLRLGLFGVADVVEFDGGAAESGERGPPFPVEYKRGRPKKHDADRVQLCAQAMCLEEMLGVVVPRGALFYGRTHRRLAVEFDAGLRAGTEEAAAQLHALLAGGTTPPAVRGAWCKRCSLVDCCMPGTLDHPRSARRYLQRAVNDCLAEGEA